MGKGVLFEKGIKLYAGARAGDEVALGMLHQLAVPWLAWWLRRKHFRIPPWEIEAASENAFSSMAVALVRITSWPRAVVFMERTAVHAAITAFRAARKYDPIPEACADHIDPESGDSFELTDCLELAEAIATRLPSELCVLFRDRVGALLGRLVLEGGETRSACPDCCGRTRRTRSRALQAACAALFIRLNPSTHGAYDPRKRLSRIRRDFLPDAGHISVLT